MRKILPGKKQKFKIFLILVFNFFIAGSFSFMTSASDPEYYQSLTAAIENVHKGMDCSSRLEKSLAEKALDARPDSVGYLQSDKYPIRSHYPRLDLQDRAQQILDILEETYQYQTQQLGFPVAPADCGNGGSDDLDIYIQDLPSGIGGYAAFTCYIEETPEADAASFIAIAESVPDGMLRGAVAHEFNHVLQNAIDYWENITFKENTATWVMDMAYDDENAYFNYLRAYQKNPDWPIHKFSTTNTYQYGQCIFLHFLSEYYCGGTGDIVKDLWFAAVQNELNNEPDYIDVMDEVIGVYSFGRDSFHDALQEFSIWRTVTGETDDGVHFHDGSQWPQGASVAFDTALSGESFNFPVTINPQNPPYDYGFSYVKIENPSAIDSTLALFFQGDTAVEWAVTLIQTRYGTSQYISRELPVDDGSGLLLINPGMYTQADDLIIAVVNLGNDSFDPDTGNDGERRGYSLEFIEAQPDSTLQLWTQQPATAPGMTYELTSEIEYYGYGASIDYWLFLEVLGEYFSIFADPEGIPVPQQLALNHGDIRTTREFAFEMPEITNMALVWHGAIMNGPIILDYQFIDSNLIQYHR